MGTYKGIQGYAVESLASAPTPTQVHVGKLWYNSASNVWKIVVDDGGYTVKTITTS